jgi:hypothetical protein
MNLEDTVIRCVAAEEDAARRYRVATAMLAGREKTADLHQVFHHALSVSYGEHVDDGERAAARCVIDVVAGTLLARVDAMDEMFERLLDRIAEKDGEDEEYDPSFYDPNDGLTVVLAPEDDEDDQHELMLDMLAEPGRVHLTMRRPEQGGESITGWLAVEDVRYMRRRLDIVARHAKAIEPDDEGEEGDA